MIAIAKILLLISASLSWQSADASETYLCRITPLTKDVWIPSEVAVQVFEEQKLARIWDVSSGGAVPVTVEQRSENTFLLDWTVAKATLAKFPGMGGERYQAMFNKQNLKISLRVLSGFEREGVTPRGAGTCVSVSKR